MDLIKLLIKHEGKVPHAYQDHLGYWTIGVGRLIDKRMSGRLTDEEIEFLLKNDIKEKTQQCKQIPFFDSLDSVRQDALINLCFNMGINNLLEFKNTLKAIEEKRWHEAEMGLKNSLWAKQVQQERVDDICYMITQGKYR